MLCFGRGRGEVGDGAYRIAAALEMRGEAKCILRGTVVMRPLECLADAQVPAPAPSYGDLFVYDVLVQGVNERVLSGGARSGHRLILGNTQKTIRSCQVLTRSFDRTQLTVDHLRDPARGERVSTHAGRFEQRAVSGAHALELEANHLAQVVGHFEP